MSTNKNILNAKNVKKNPFRDEFYTTRRTIEYLFKDIDKKDFENKTVYCNCDLPWSEFYVYLKENFKSWKLRKLIATGYNLDENGHGVKCVYDGQTETISELNGRGDYRDEECLAIIDEADIIATNPPFSLLDDYIPRMLDTGRDILIICNMMALGHRPIRKYLLSGNTACCPINGDNHLYVQLAPNAGQDFVKPDISLGYIPTGPGGLVEYTHSFENIGLTYIPSAALGPNWTNPTYTQPDENKRLAYIPSEGSKDNIFKKPDGELKNVLSIGLTTLTYTKPFRKPTKTLEELEKAGRINYTDDTGIMEVTNVEHLPIDYYGPVLAPISAALRPWIKERWRVVRFCDEPVIVGGKQRFYRFELRRMEGVAII